jgi:hypothetical protein
MLVVDRNVIEAFHQFQGRVCAPTTRSCPTSFGAMSEATGHKATGSNKRSKPKRRVIRSDPPSKDGVDRMDLPPARGYPVPPVSPHARRAFHHSPPSWSSSFRGAYFGISRSEGSDVHGRCCCCRPRSPHSNQPPLFGSISPIDVGSRSDDGSSASIYKERDSRAHRSYSPSFILHL